MRVPSSVLVLFLAACGRGGSGDAAPPPPSPLVAQNAEPVASPASPHYGLIYEEHPAQAVTMEYDDRFTPAEVAAIERAFGTWNAAAGQDVLALGATFTVEPGRPLAVWSRDASGKWLPLLGETSPSRIYRADDWREVGEARTIGLTQPFLYPDFNGAGIGLFLNFNCFQLTDALAPEAPANAQDLETVLLHELGHVIGLNHVDASANAASIMLPTLSLSAGVTRRAPSPDDAALVRFFYGSAAANPYESRLVLPQKNSSLSFGFDADECARLKAGVR